MTTLHSARRAVAPAGFHASAALAEHLQRVLADLVELHLQGKQAHWTLVGGNFRDLHLQLDEIVAAAREYADTIAERMRALAAVPDGRSDTVAATTSLPSYPPGEQSTTRTVDLVTGMLHATVATMRAVHDAVDTEDPTSADLLHAAIQRLEQYAWLVGAENGVTGS